ncbi:hypothetical protein ACS0TY_011638 [Phlomoides rotata]
MEQHLIIRGRGGRFDVERVSLQKNQELCGLSPGYEEKHRCKRAKKCPCQYLEAEFFILRDDNGGWPLRRPQHGPSQADVEFLWVIDGVKKVGRRRENNGHLPQRGAILGSGAWPAVPPHDPSDGRNLGKETGKGVGGGMSPGSDCMGANALGFGCFWTSLSRYVEEQESKLHRHFQA